MEASRLGSAEAIKFLQTAMDELYQICQTKFTGEGRFPSEIPVYCLLDEEQHQEPKFNLNGVMGIHNEATLAAAQAVVEAICPELGIQITDDNATLIESADLAKTLGYAEFSSLGGDYYAAMAGTLRPAFSTVLEGVNLSISCRPDGRYICLAWQVM